MTSPLDPPFGESAPDAHVDAVTLAALADGWLGASRRASVEAHMASCAECRAELYDVRRLVRARPRPQLGVRRWAAIGSAAAAIAATILFTTLPQDRPDSGPSAERSTRVEEAPPLGAYQPPRSGSAPRASLRFAWEAAGPGARYQLMLVDSVGTELWRVETSDTSVTPPASLVLPRQALLFWYVDALQPDGRTRTTRALPLRLEP
jgi:hypothetical protein